LNSDANPHRFQIHSNVLQSRGFTGFETTQVGNVLPATRGNQLYAVAAGAPSFLYRTGWIDGVFTLPGNSQYFGKFASAVCLTNTTGTYITPSPYRLPRANETPTGLVTWGGAGTPSIVNHEFSVYEDNYFDILF
jgi:hypothetical protein